MILRSLAGRYVGAAADVGADGEEGGVEAGHLTEQVADTMPELELDPERQDPADLRVQDFTREPVGGDPVAHHPARAPLGVADRDRVAGAPQVVRGRQAGRAGADDQHPLARLGGGGLERPAAADRLIAEEPLDPMDPNGGVELRAVARGLAGVVTDPAHDRGQGVVVYERSPRYFVVTVLRFVEPGLNVLPGRAGVVAGRHAIDVRGALVAP